ncbi:MAG: hypothetical protein ACKV2V_00010 [Blastocatellia bacterium]
MEITRAYEEFVNLIAMGTTPESVIAFRPSPEAQERIDDLVYRAKNIGLSASEQKELDHYVEVEHLLRMAKALSR